MTFSRRGSQNSSATIERVDHSAPTYVAPITKPSIAVAAATPKAPLGRSSVSVNGRLSM